MIMALASNFALMGNTDEINAVYCEVDGYTKNVPPYPHPIFLLKGIILHQYICKKHKYFINNSFALISRGSSVGLIGTTGDLPGSLKL